MPPIRIPFEIATFHIDFVGHVSNIVYIQWLEIARCRLLEAVGLPVADLAKSHGIVPVLLETQIAYKRQLVMGQRPYIEVWLSELGRASAIMNFRICHENGDIAAEATQKGMFCSHPDMKPYRIPPDMRGRFNQFVIQTA
jgi:acyl-CoA thioester hydrolase